MKYLTPSSKLLTLSLIILALGACSKSSLKGKSSTLGSGPNNNINGIVKSIKCSFETSGAVVSGYDDGQGNLLPGTTAPAVQFKVRGTANGGSADFFVLRTNFDTAGIRMEGSPSFNNDRSANVSMRPLKPGTYSVDITIASPQDTSVTDTCRAQVTLQTTRPAQTAVLIAANGVLNQLPQALPNRSQVQLNWASINATSCSLFSNNIQIPNVTQTAGELITAPLVNDTGAPVVFAFEARCVASVGGAVTVARVNVPINPNATASLSIVGQTSPAKVRKNATVDLQWFSQYAECALGDGINSQIVPSQGSMSYVAAASKTFTLICRQGAATVAQASVQVIALDPSATITANGTRTAYTKPNTGDIAVAWSSVDVNSCSVTPFNATEKNGSRVITDLQSTTTYRIVCQSDLGEVSDQVVVTVPGRWVACDSARNGQECELACGRAGMALALSPDGYQCASGEVLAESAIGKFTFPYGVWPSGTQNVKHGAPAGRLQGVMGRWCYGTGQKTDNDATDKTVAVYCK